MAKPLKAPYAVKVDAAGTKIKPLAIAVARALDNMPLDKPVRSPETHPKSQEKLP